MGKLVANVHAAHLVECDHIAARCRYRSISINNVHIVLFGGTLSRLILVNDGELANLLQGCETNVGVLAVVGKWVVFLDHLYNLEECTWLPAANIDCLENLGLKLILELPFD